MVAGMTLTNNRKTDACDVSQLGTLTAQATCTDAKDASRQIVCICSPVAAPDGGSCVPWVEGGQACAAGQTGPAGSCEACAAGKYKEAAGDAACSDCPTGSSSPAGSTATTACTCNDGFTGPDGGACGACEAGKYKAASGSDECGECLAASYSEAGASACSSCPANSNSPAGSKTNTACTCNAGYKGPDGGACEADEAPGGGGDTPECSGTVSSGGVCTCPGGHAIFRSVLSGVCR